MASSAAPSSGGVDPEGGGRDLDHRARRAEHPGPDAFGDLALGDRVEAAEQPAEHDQLGVEQVDQVADAEAEPAPDLGAGFVQHRVARRCPGEHAIDVRPSGRPVTLGAGGTQQRLLARLGLPAADGAAPAANARPG